MKRNSLIVLVGVMLIITLIVVYSSRLSDEALGIIVEAERGEFVVDVMTSGSLEAKNSVEITGPNGLRNYRIWNMTIQHIIEEGTYVKKGQYVARLDPSELTGKIKDAQLGVDERQSQYTQTQLDTALTMRQARDELVNLQYAVRERQLTLDQSQYEPPATIQKAEIELEKAKQALNQAKENYKIKRRQNVAKMQEAAIDLKENKNELEGLLELSEKFTIYAPEDGMLIYRKGRDGKPLKEGSQVSAWDPVIATLPDLSQMLSKTYINEVDIRKVKVGQMTEIGFDAFPEKKLNGQVIKVANVGEQRPNSDARVFEVMVEVFGTDPLLKPGMTTSNTIITKKIEDGIFIPLECLHSQFDSITYVFKKQGVGMEKQEVMIGDANAEDVLILAGLQEGDKVSLSRVSGMEEEAIQLMPEMDGKRMQKKEPEPDQNTQGNQGYGQKRKRRNP